MRIKMHQTQRLSEPGFGHSQERQGHRMIAAQKHTVVPIHQQRGLALDGFAHHRQGRGVGQNHVQRITHVLNRRHVEHRVSRVAQHQAGGANRLRPKARARSVGHHAVVGHATDRKSLLV